MVQPFFHTGGIVVHSYGRLIPHDFPITDLQQISGPDGIGRINCTVSSGAASFKMFENPLPERVTEIRNGSTASLTVNATDFDSFHNIEGKCKLNVKFNYFYVFLAAKSKCVCVCVCVCVCMIMFGNWTQDIIMLSVYF